jgi:hypothetical protein
MLAAFVLNSLCHEDIVREWQGTTHQVTVKVPPTEVASRNPWRVVTISDSVFLTREIRVPRNRRWYQVEFRMARQSLLSLMARSDP